MKKRCREIKMKEEKIRNFIMYIGKKIKTVTERKTFTSDNMNSIEPAGRQMSECIWREKKLTVFFVYSNKTYVHI